MAKRVVGGAEDGGGKRGGAGGCGIEYIGVGKVGEDEYVCTQPTVRFANQGVIKFKTARLAATWHDVMKIMSTTINGTGELAAAGNQAEAQAGGAGHANSLPIGQLNFPEHCEHTLFVLQVLHSQVRE
jgi:hypothetical protein